ncbi:hypothetical protein [Clostridium tarantellae]|uniref:Uncharacterized protein n=1 Tax=Clostridium tarantellae TaxID=39493 RepID=A0A6I1MNQ3_9CLOT|nr:hypothetical protein [Clostridium tarantellae]MPQ43892.1 hypothetical protein [Clostridium tarantellae]
MKKKTFLVGALSAVASITAGILVKKKYNEKKKQNLLKNKKNIMFTTSFTDLYDTYEDKEGLLSEEDIINEIRKETSI